MGVPSYGISCMLRVPRLLLKASQYPAQARLFSSSLVRTMRVLPIPVREDNYAYLLIDNTSKKAAAVDPYSFDKVKAAADQYGVQIVAVITTHHHFDHSGGNEVRCNSVWLPLGDIESIWASIIAIREFGHCYEITSAWGNIVTIDIRPKPSRMYQSMVAATKSKL